MPSEDPPIKRKEFYMNPKYQKVLSDIEKAEKKKSEICLLYTSRCV